MLVVLAGREDASARGLVQSWAADAQLLTCRDLSRAGWRYTPGCAGGTAMIGGDPVPVERIDGVLTRLPAVFEHELGAIAPADRGYVAEEMTACLLAWLSELPCPVLNRPSPVSLMGPPWTREQWVLTARKLGIGSGPARRSVPSGTAAAGEDPRSDGAVVTVVGGRAVGQAAASSEQAALALARAAGVGLLRARFASAGEQAPFLDADYWADVADPQVADAILHWFREQRPR
jgi:hypothetical protein